MSDDQNRPWDVIAEEIQGAEDRFGRYMTTGMHKFDLPEVAVEPQDGAPFELAVEAGRLACKRMVDEDRLLEPGEAIEIDGPDGPLKWTVEPIEDDEEIVLVPFDEELERYIRDQGPTDYGETTPEEAYFLNELGIGTKNVVACGYLTTPIRYDSKGQTMADAAMAKSAFVALTHGAIHLVHTRTPATSKPLLENQGTQTASLAHVFDVSADGESLVLDLGHEKLAFEPKLENRWFPSQKKLIEGLLALDDSAPSLDALERLRLKARLKRWWPLAMAIVIAFIIFLLKELEVWI